MRMRLVLGLVGTAIVLILLLRVDATPATPWRLADHVARPGDSSGTRPYRLLPTAREVWIEIMPGHCWPAFKEGSPVKQLEVAETNSAITITAHVQRAESGLDCLTTHIERVPLDAPLGDRILIDGSDESRRRG